MTTTASDIDLARILRRIRRQKLNLTTAETLAEIERRGEANLTTLSTILDVSPASMTNIADSLEKLGLVNRKPVPGDRRAYTLRVTKHGRAALEIILA